jgi:hypothetical protein
MLNVAVCDTQAHCIASPWHTTSGLQVVLGFDPSQNIPKLSFCSEYANVLISQIWFSKACFGCDFLTSVFIAQGAK